MATRKQLQANRLNARKSTGPRSVEGKAASRMNALKSGIDAASALIRGESQAQLDTLTAEYYASFHPVTPEERTLVDVLVSSEWILRRLRRVESQLWEHSIGQLTSGHDTELGQAFAQQSQVFARLQRRMDSVQRNYRNAINDLVRLQKEIGFVPQVASEQPEKADPEPLCDVVFLPERGEIAYGAHEGV